MYDYLAEMRDSSVTNILFASWQSVQFICVHLLWIRCSAGQQQNMYHIFTYFSIG